MAASRQSMQRLVFKQGYLKKIPNSSKFGASFKRAERRWFVFGALCGIPFLEYYDSEEGQFKNPPINSISLMTCRFVNHSEDMRYQFVIHIGLVDRVLSLVAPNNEDMAAWEKELKKKLEKLGVLQGQSDEHHIYSDDPLRNVRTRKNSRDPNSPLPAPPTDSTYEVPLLSDAAAMGTSLLQPHSNAQPSSNTDQSYEEMWTKPSIANRDSLSASYMDPDLYSQFPMQTPVSDDVFSPAIPMRNNSRNLSIVTGHARSAANTHSSGENNAAASAADSAAASCETASVLMSRSTQHASVNGNITSENSSPVAVLSDEPIIVSPKMLEAYSHDNESDCPIFGWRAPPPEDGAPPPYSPAVPPARQRSLKSLKESQVEHLRKEISNSGGVRVVLNKVDCHHTIAFVDCFGAVWIAGWNQTARPFLYTALHIGDQLISINSQVVESSRVAEKLIKRCTDHDTITMVIRRTPHAKVHRVRRSAEGENLGLHRDGGTAEVVYVDPNGLAATSGLTPKTPTLDRSSFCNWVLTEINNRPLNLFFKDNEIEHRLNAVGLDITFLVQPKDFVMQLKKQLKAIKNYKDFLIQ